MCGCSPRCGCGGGRLGCAAHLLTAEVVVCGCGFSRSGGGDSLGCATFLLTAEEMLGGGGSGDSGLRGGVRPRNVCVALGGRRLCEATGLSLMYPYVHGVRVPRVEG
jgi:hypothetical protein